MKTLFLLPILLLPFVSVSGVWESYDKQYACFEEGGQKPYSVTIGGEATSNMDIWITWDKYPVRYDFIFQQGQVARVAGKIENSPQLDFDPEELFEGNSTAITKGLRYVITAFKPEFNKLVVYFHGGLQPHLQIKMNCIPL